CNHSMAARRVGQAAFFGNRARRPNDRRRASRHRAFCADAVRQHGSGVNEARPLRSIKKEPSGKFSGRLYSKLFPILVNYGYRLLISQLWRTSYTSLTSFCMRPILRCKSLAFGRSLFNVDNRELSVHKSTPSQSEYV